MTMSLSVRSTFAPTIVQRLHAAGAGVGAVGGDRRGAAGDRFERGDAEVLMPEFADVAAR